MMVNFYLILLFLFILSFYFNLVLNYQIDTYDYEFIHFHLVVLYEQFIRHRLLSFCILSRVLVIIFNSVSKLLILILYFSKIHFF